MAIPIRGGVPDVFRATIDTTGRDHGIASFTHFLQISNEGANDLRVYFTQEDFANDDKYIELDAVIGFYEGPAEVGRVWFKAVGGNTDVFAIFYARRG